jgi:E3 ubiquitin-protein ligase Topors
MCKTSFNTLIHNVEANDKYTQVKVEPRARSSGLDVSLGEARRFRYRTTRVPGEARTSTSHLSAQQQSGREREATPMEERERRDRERERRERRRAMSQQLSNPASDERRRVVYSLGLWAQPPRTDGRKERVREISQSSLYPSPGSMADQRVPSAPGPYTCPVHDSTGPLSH